MGILSNLTGWQWWAYFGFLLELIGLAFLALATYEQVAAWRNRARDAVVHLRGVGVTVSAGTATISGTLDEAEENSIPDRLGDLEDSMQQMQSWRVDHQREERKERKQAIEKATRELRTEVGELITEAVKPITEWLDTTSTPWKAYLGSALLIAGLTISTIVNTIQINPAG